MRTSKWSIEDLIIATEISKDKSLNSKQKVTKLRELFPNNSVTSLAIILNLHRRTIHRHLLD
jgi:hypothetical protein